VKNRARVGFDAMRERIGARSGRKFRRETHGNFSIKNQSPRSSECTRTERSRANRPCI
jgi:ribosomal protein L37AE/L43A